MSLVTRVTELANAVGEDVKQLNGKLNDAGAWPIVSEDPENPVPGHPWLLLGVTADYVPLGVRCGFNRSSIPPDSSSIVAQLSIKTEEGFVVRFNPSAMS